MKYLLVLAGNSVRNRAWGEACVQKFEDQFDLTFFPQYKHWESGEPQLDFETELELLRKMTEGVDKNTEWYIFAKSIGTILAMKAVQQKIIVPTKCVFFGLPLAVARDGDWSFLSEFNSPTLAYHNDHDPVADYACAVSKLKAVASKINLKTLSGSTHDYLDFADYESDINNFIGH